MATPSTGQMPPRQSGFIKEGDPMAPTSGAEVPFRDIIPEPSHPKIAGIASHDALSWCESRRQIAAPAWLISRLDAENIEKPFVGFTTDGTARKGVYEYAQDEGAPVESMVSAAEGLLGMLESGQRKEVQFEGVEVDEFRLWSNPELYVNPGGLRLDECPEPVREAVHEVLKASFSEAGYAKVLGCCLTNGFLGHLVNGPKVLNEHSYNFRLFGDPSADKPWGYTFFGHHLCLAVAIWGRRMVIGPTFLGAEPDRIDEGPHKGLRLFQTEELAALILMQSLSPKLQEKATLSKGMDGDNLPADRWNPFDERHLAGARQDNRIVPYGKLIKIRSISFRRRSMCLPSRAEGCPIKLFSSEQQEQIVELYRAFNAYYPEAVLAHRLRNFRDHLDETYFAWIGPCGEHDAFYYRIHSPVSFMELDFHCGSKCVI